MQETLYLCGLTGSRTIRNDLQKTRLGLAPKRKVVGSNPARNASGEADYISFPFFSFIIFISETPVL